VPVHVIAGDPALLDPLDRWGWTPGTMPDAKTPTEPMAAFRAGFIAAFTGREPAKPGVTGAAAGLSAPPSGPGSAAIRRQ
jgi:hypothetical protein